MLRVGIFDGDHTHSGSLSRLNAYRDIFKYQTGARIDPEFSGRDRIDLRIRFSQPDVVAGRDRVNIIIDPMDPQDIFDELKVIAGRDRGLMISRFHFGKELPDAGLQRDRISVFFPCHLKPCVSDLTDRIGNMESVLEIPGDICIREALQFLLQVFGDFNSETHKILHIDLMPHAHGIDQGPVEVKNDCAALIELFLQISH